MKHYYNKTDIENYGTKISYSNPDCVHILYFNY